MTAEQLISVGSLINREAMGDQCLSTQGACAHGMEHGLEVALLRPTHKTNRVVVPLLLIGRVVAPGAAGTAHWKGQFLFVEKVAAKLETSNTDEHDATSLAAYLGGYMYRLTRGSGGSDQNSIYTDTTGLLYTRPPGRYPEKG